MTNKPNKTLIGTFLISGLLAFLLIIGISVVRNWYGNHKETYVMYFHESIKGLNIGAPVVLNGVEIGKVAKIEIVPDVATYSFDIPVYITFNDIRKVISSPSKNDLSEEKMVATLVERGLYGKLISQNLLTGQLMIELNMQPHTTNLMRKNMDDPHEIPTVLSQITEISESMQSIPFYEVFDNISQTLVELKSVIEPVAKISRDLSNKSAVTINNFNKTMQDVSRAANSVRALTEYLEQHPESLLRGKQ